MSISTLTAAAAANTTPPSSKVNTFSTMEGNEFMQLLLVELKHQDPLKPMDSSEIMAQITQLNSLQELQAINGGIQMLGENDDLVEAASLIDTMVSYISADGLVKTGLVSAITRSGEQTRLLIGADSVALGDVLSIQAAVQEG
jgi:flagellar basal-body rod modification protein FlgD